MLPFINRRYPDLDIIEIETEMEHTDSGGCVRILPIKVDNKILSMALSFSSIKMKANTSEPKYEREFSFSFLPISYYFQLDLSFKTLYKWARGNKKISEIEKELNEESEEEESDGEESEETESESEDVSGSEIESQSDSDLDRENFVEVDDIKESELENKKIINSKSFFIFVPIAVASRVGDSLHLSKNLNSLKIYSKKNKSILMGHNNYDNNEGNNGGEIEDHEEESKKKIRKYIEENILSYCKRFNFSPILYPNVLSNNIIEFQYTQLKLNQLSSLCKPIFSLPFHSLDKSLIPSTSDSSSDCDDEILFAIPLLRLFIDLKNVYIKNSTDFDPGLTPVSSQTPLGSNSKSSFFSSNSTQSTLQTFSPIPSPAPFPPPFSSSCLSLIPHNYESLINKCYRKFSILEQIKIDLELPPSARSSMRLSMRIMEGIFQNERGSIKRNSMNQITSTIQAYLNSNSEDNKNQTLSTSSSSSIVVNRLSVKRKNNNSETIADHFSSDFDDDFSSSSSSPSPLDFDTASPKLKRFSVDHSFMKSLEEDSNSPINQHSQLFGPKLDEISQFQYNPFTCANPFQSSTNTSKNIHQTHSTSSIVLSNSSTSTFFQQFSNNSSLSSTNDPLLSLSQTDVSNLSKVVPPNPYHDSFQIIFLGTGCATPSKHRNNSGILITCLQKPQNFNPQDFEKSKSKSKSEDAIPQEEEVQLTLPSFLLKRKQAASSPSPLTIETNMDNDKQSQDSGSNKRRLNLNLQISTDDNEIDLHTSSTSSISSPSISSSGNQIEPNIIEEINNINPSILLDCGEGTVSQIFQSVGGNLKRFDEVLLSIRVVWISHHHADHATGIPMLLHYIYLAQLRSKKNKLLMNSTGVNSSSSYISADSYNKYNIMNKKRNGQSKNNFINLNNTSSTSKFMELANKVVLIGSESVLKYMEYVSISSGLDHLISFYPIINSQFAGMTNDIQLITYGAIKNLVSIPVKHCTSSFGIVFKLFNGVKIVYSGDCRPSTSLVKYGKDCDLLIHEATFDDSKSKEAERKKHSTLSEAVKISKEMRAKHLVLTHFSQRYPIGYAGGMNDFQTPISANPFSNGGIMLNPHHNLNDRNIFSTPNLFSPTSSSSSASNVSYASDFLKFSFPSQVHDIPKVTNSIIKILNSSEHLNEFVSNIL